MYGARFVGSEGEVSIEKGTSHGAIAVNDLVTVKTDGQVEVSAAGDLIAGVAISAATGAGVTVYYLRGAGLKVIMDNDNTGTTFAATHVGGRFDHTGTTGAMLVDTSTVAQTGGTADTGGLLCLAYNPQGYGFDSDTSIGLFQIVERQ
jgi:hypothetical protein